MKINYKLLLKSILSVGIITTPILISQININNNVNNLEYSNKCMVNSKEQNINKNTNSNKFINNLSMIISTNDNNGTKGLTAIKNSDRWETLNYNYLVDVNKIFNNYIIGNFKDYIYQDKTYLDIFESDDNLHWYTDLGSSNIIMDHGITNGYVLERIDNFGKFPPFRYEYKKITKTLSIKFDGSKSFNNLGGYTDSWGPDISEIRISTSAKYDKSTEILTIVSNNELHALEKDAIDSASDVHSQVTKLSNNVRIKYNITLPYSNYDLAVFREQFKQIIAKPIRIKDAKNPIIFDYQSNPNDIKENEQYVLNEIQKRIDAFNSNESLLNKFGNVVTYDNKLNKFINTKDVKIYLQIPSNVRGKSGTVNGCNVVFELTNGRKFDFGDGNDPKTTYSCPITIFLELDPSINFEINNLVTITPYISATKNNQFYINNNDNQLVLGGNQPDPLMIDLFNININEKNQQGIYQLIDNDKLPIINKVGTNINVNIEFKLNDIIIKKQLVFERLFNNGVLYTDIEINENDYQTSNIRFVDNKLRFGIKMIGDKIIIFNPKPFKLKLLDNSINLNDINVNLKIINSSATIPSEQITAPSKWVQTSDAKYYENEQLQFVGEFKTFDPFFFKFLATTIELRDPITNESIGYASKYKPFIRKGKFTSPSGSTSKNDEPIFPKPQINDEQAIYEANFGTYVMKNKTQNGTLDFQIVIKEFDNNVQSEDINEKYTKDRWIIGISMDLLNDQAKFIMSGYKDNKLIEQENKQKYFNKDSVDYRGDYVDEQTGMYKPKIVWVNAFPPESFLYDPLDESGNNIVDKNSSNNDDQLKAQYDIGYIAELNATGFSNNDYVAMPTFGGYETNFDTSIFKPTGLIPYSQFYTFNKNNIEPSIETTPLSQSGLQTIKSTNDFRQIVLKRPNSNNYLYQFVKIAPSSKEIIENKNVIDLYGNFTGLNNKPLFVDFWDTYQGKHLMNYLVNDYKIFDSEEAVKELNYSDVIQYWNIYVNDPSHYNQNINNDYDGVIDISVFQQYFNPIILSCGDFNELRKTLINQITSQLMQVLSDNNCIDENVNLEYGVHFIVEPSEDIFNKKIDELINNYSLELSQVKPIDFEVIMNVDAFKNNLFKPTGKINISVLNNKDANQIIDLSQYTGSKLSINTAHEYFKNSPNMIKLIKDTIYESINNDLKRIINQSSLSFKDEYVPTINKDYQLIFYTKYIDNYGEEKIHKYLSIDQAINDALLYKTDNNVFYNTLFVEVKAIFNENHHYMINSFHKTIINNSSQKEPIIDLAPFDLSKVKAHDIKINTKHADFPANTIDEQAEFIYSLMIERVYNDIYYYANKWIQINKVDIKYQQDFEIILIKDFDQNNKPIYYEANNQFEFLDIIKQRLLLGIDNDQKFDKNLYFEVRGISGSNLENKYIKKINNSYLNKAIEDDILDDVIIDNENNGFNDIDNSKLPLNNNKGSGDDFDWWWVVTPITIFIVCVIALLVAYFIRKNRKVR